MHFTVCASTYTEEPQKWVNNGNGSCITSFSKKVDLWFFQSLRNSPPFLTAPTHGRVFVAKCSFIIIPGCIASTKADLRQLVSIVARYLSFWYRRKLNVPRYKSDIRLEVRLKPTPVTAFLPLCGCAINAVHLNVPKPLYSDLHRNQVDAPQSVDDQVA